MKLEELESQQQKVREASEIARTISGINDTLEEIKKVDAKYGSVYVTIMSASIKVDKNVAQELLLKEKARLEKELEEI